MDERNLVWGKLVRDGIPDIIRADGLSPVVWTVSGAKHSLHVRAKLREELDEFLDSGDPVELADLIEVCFAAAAIQNVGRDELMEMVRDKRERRGGFDGRVVWFGNREASGEDNG